MVAYTKVSLLVVIAALVLTFDLADARQPLPFIGEVRWMSFQFAPEGWLFCDGKEYSIKDYPKLAKVIGNRYGGDGKTKFKVPDLRKSRIGNDKAKDILRMYPAIAASTGVYPVRHYT